MPVDVAPGPADAAAHLLGDALEVVSVGGLALEEGLQTLLCAAPVAGEVAVADQLGAIPSIALALPDSWATRIDRSLTRLAARASPRSSNTDARLIRPFQRRNDRLAASASSMLRSISRMPAGSPRRARAEPMVRISRALRSPRPSRSETSSASPPMSIARPNSPPSIAKRATVLRISTRIGEIEPSGTSASASRMCAHTRSDEPRTHQLAASIIRASAAPSRSPAAASPSHASSSTASSSPGSSGRLRPSRSSRRGRSGVPGGDCATACS